MSEAESNEHQMRMNGLSPSGFPMPEPMSEKTEPQTLPDPVIQSLKLWMAEVTSLLCYQPEIPMAHKTDICNALTDFDKALAFYTGKARVDQSQ